MLPVVDETPCQLPPPGGRHQVAAARHRFIALLLAVLGSAVVQTGHAAAFSPGRFVEADGWKAGITVDCLLKDQRCGTFRYEALACEGDLIYDGETATGFQFRTELRAGRCVPGCTIEISADFRRYAEVCRDSRHEGALTAVGAPGTAAAPMRTPAATSASPAAGPRAGGETRGLSGPVHFRWPNGDVFDGEMLDGKRNGRGRMVWASGQSYDGEWRDDAAVGEGTLVLVDGDRYQGQVQDGVPHGRGRMVFATGDTYEGRFEMGVADVEGVFTQKDGSRYSGQWKAGLKQGRGKFAWASGQTYEGDWVADKPQGTGVITFANGDRYEGQVANGLPEGKGVKTFASGDRYEGQFVKGQAQGEGVQRWKNGDIYTGSWQQGKKVGIGRYQWANGDYWEGEFVDDKRTAAGRLHFTPTVTAAGGDGARVAMQADALSGPTDASGGRPQAAAGGDRSVDRTRLLAIPMVAREVRDCSRQQRSDCPSRVVDDVLADRIAQHRWQTMASEKGPKGKASVFDVDSNSVLEGGNVFSWLRSGDGTQARNIGIKYDCRAQTLEIQLIYHCTGSEACVLDPSIDKYAGKVLPATDIKGWFKEACER